MTTMRHIGNPVKLRRTGDGAPDPQDKINTKFRQFMSVVDLIPVNWKLDLSNFETSKGGYVTYYEFDEAIVQFQKDCNFYFNDETNYVAPEGLRCWLTGDTIFQEELGNEFSENIISKGLNALSDVSRTLSQLRNLNKSASGVAKEAIQKAGGTDVGKQVKDVGAKVEAFKQGLPSSIQGIVSNASDIAGSIITEGKHTSLPKIWHGSSYNPSLALNVQLISPYGDPKSVLEHVIKPLAYLYILAAPRTNDGITYGKVRYVYMKGYGITHLPLGYIESLSISRGGEDTTYNKFRQPLSVNVSMSIKPAAEGFGIIDPDYAAHLEEFKMKDFDSSDERTISPGPAFSTLGNILHSFKRVPEEISTAFITKARGEEKRQAAIDAATAEQQKNTETQTNNPEAADKQKDTKQNVKENAVVPKPIEETQKEITLQEGATVKQQKAVVEWVETNLSIDKIKENITGINNKLISVIPGSDEQSKYIRQLDELNSKLFNNETASDDLRDIFKDVINV